MPHPRQADLAALIDALNAAGVEYLVVGGGAAVIHGAGVNTLDLDIVPRRTEGNADRLHGVLAGLDVHIIEPMHRKLAPRVSDFRWGRRPRSREGREVCERPMASGRLAWVPSRSTLCRPIKRRSGPSRVEEV